MSRLPNSLRLVSELMLMISFSDSPNDQNLSLLAETVVYQFETRSKCIIDAIETRAPSLIKELGLSVLVCCICVRDILEQNPLSTRLLSSPIPTEIIHFFSDFNWIYIYGNRLVTSFALFLSMRNNNNPSLQDFVQRWKLRVRSPTDGWDEN